MAAENDIVLIYMEEKPLVFARIEAIAADHKPDWYHVDLLFLQIPLQVVTWILKDAYINGEPYTMGGQSMRLELVKSPALPAPVDADAAPPADKETGKRPPGTASGGKIISLADMKKSR